MDAILLDSTTPPDMNMHHVDMIYDKVIDALQTAFLDARQDPTRYPTLYLVGFDDAMRIVENVASAETYQSGDKLGGL